MEDAFGLADRVLAHDPSNSLAHLALGVKAIKAKRLRRGARLFREGGAGQQRDIPRRC
jgi:hypothetical protein